MDIKATIDYINNTVVKNTLLETLSIKLTEIGDDFVVLQMPVNSTVHQPAGLLHGGASVALAESAGSIASHLFIDNDKFEVRGLEISANHVKAKRDGVVTAIARPIHKGRKTHLWEVKITDEHDNLISICKLTMIVLSKK